MSEEKQVPSGGDEGKEVTPENKVTTEQNEAQESTSQEETTVENTSTESPVSETTEDAAAEPVAEVPEETKPVAEDASSDTTEPVDSEESGDDGDTASETEASEEEAPAETAPEPETPVAEHTEAAEDITDNSPEAETTATDEAEEVNEAETVASPADAAEETVPATSEAAEEETSKEDSPAETEAVTETIATEASDDSAQPAEEEAGKEENPPETDAVTETAATEASDDSVKPTEESPEGQTTTEDAPVAETAAETEDVPADAAETPGKAEDTEQDDHGQEEPKEEEIIDYSNHTREQLAEVVDELSKQDNFKRSDIILSKVMPLFKAMARARRQEAMEKFLADGGEKDDFEFRHDEVFNRFDASVRLIRDRRANFYKEREARKEANYQKKLEILDKLRELVDGENATTNLSPIKALQEEWKSLGPVPAQHNRTLWANFNALLDRFYNNRHILFELKELDRKKNLVKKQELCEKAEALDKLENIKDAIVQLNELHEEYKKIGAVPREVQEELWQRFKGASDAIYKKRKSYLEDLKGELHQNLEKKKALAEELKPFLTFDSDRINDWNAKTKEILAIQKQWDALGGLPREYAKEVNKMFWSAFKGFFSNKNAFFKKLEGMRHENLQKKEELVAKAEGLMENTDWDKTSEALKQLQRQWKEIGPVPEKFRNSVYAKFKEACDTFFNNRRANQNKAEAQFVENLKHKEDMVKEIHTRTEAGDGQAADLDDLMIRWSAIGFVPRGAIKTIEEKFAKAIDAFVKSLDVPEEEREALVMKAELSSLKKGPNSDRRLNKKEAILRKQIQELEDNINLWNNNLAFFANSKTADKLKAEFDEKIAKAEDEIQHLKKQLRMVRSM